MVRIGISALSGDARSVDTTSAFESVIALPYGMRIDSLNNCTYKPFEKYCKLSDCPEYL